MKNIRVIKTEKEFALFLRNNIDDVNGNVPNRLNSDEWLVNNSHELEEWEYSKEGYIVHRWEIYGGINTERDWVILNDR